MLKQYKITDNGFLWIYEDGIRISTHFYHKGHEKFWEDDGYSRLK